MANPKTQRCAIYTRKSSEEGLEQDFNSLHAQREACEAYIRSQRHEGWRLIETHYDDGGLSGGTMERPALQRLLEDIRADRVDIIVVYKVDRLTRSLADFAKMVELFDTHGVSFVAVTQQFNTTTSMGRLTLNVLLSFAQFEREVTGERIRDKIAASKKKGLWMGGNVPLGYDVRDRSLMTNASEAETVRWIFRRYLELRSVRLLKNELDRQGILSKVRLTVSGERRGGAAFSRGALYALLANPLYVGEIRHKGICHPGRHEPLVDRELWEAVQARLRSKDVGRANGCRQPTSSPLAGKLFDEAGQRLTPSHATKGGRRYHYYVSRHLISGNASDAAIGWRLPAREIERAAAAAACEILRDRAALAEVLQNAGMSLQRIAALLDSAAALSERLAGVDDAIAQLRPLIHRVELRRSGLRVTLSLAALLGETERDQAPTVTRVIPLQLRRRGNETRLVLEAGAAPTNVDGALLKVIARARSWFDELATGRVGSLIEIAKREGVTDQYVGSVLLLAFLSPKIVEAGAAGHQPADLTAKRLLERARSLPLEWAAQPAHLAIE